MAKLGLTKSQVLKPKNLWERIRVWYVMRKATKRLTKMLNNMRPELRPTHDFSGAFFKTYGEPSKFYSHRAKVLSEKKDSK